MLKTYLDTGKIVTTHGVRGEVKVEPWCNDPQLLLEAGTLYLDEEGRRPLKVESGRPQKGMLLLKFVGVDDMDAAAALRGKILYIHREQIPLEEGEYLIQDLLGCQVLDADNGQLYGTLEEISNCGASDLYHIRFADGSLRLCPAIPELLVERNPEEGRILIRPLAGLFDDGGEQA